MPTPSPRPLLLRLASALAAILALAAAAAAEVPSPAIEGPIAGRGDVFLQSTTFDLAAVGYVEEEYFLSGTATAYANAAPLGLDGVWSVTPAATAPYRTRVVVRRPLDPRRFNGTAVVEWLNVTVGRDTAVDWTFAHTELVRDGFAWVGVSAQYAGVEGEGGGGIIVGAARPLKRENPERYGSLSHPGDSFSYDIFSQAARAVRATSSAGVLGGLAAERVIASGDSQSAFRLVTYIDAVHPLAGAYDGYLVHSRGAVGAPLSQAPEPSIPVPGAAAIRGDLDVPVLLFETETDLTSALVGDLAARQPDGDRIRAWEVAGAAHLDAYLLDAGSGDLGRSPEIAGLVLTQTTLPDAVACAEPINAGPHHFVLNAAFAALDRWLRTGTAPDPAPRLEPSAGRPVELLRDANGNAVGGIRTPQVDVPIAAFRGEQGGSSFLCNLAGATSPFDAATLARLYASHGAFVAAYDASLARAVAAGFILEPDAELMRAWAARFGPGARCGARLGLFPSTGGASAAQDSAVPAARLRSAGALDRCALPSIGHRTR